MSETSRASPRRVRSICATESPELQDFRVFKSRAAHFA
jgi:hypothetical protein